MIKRIAFGVLLALALTAPRAHAAGGRAAGAGFKMWSSVMGSAAASTTDFMGFGENAGVAVITTEGGVQGVVPYSGTASNLYCKQVTAANANVPVYTVRKNGANTALTCSITNTATTCNDVTHSFTFAANDTLDIQLVNPASANATGFVTCGFQM